MRSTILMLLTVTALAVLPMVVACNDQPANPPVATKTSGVDSDALPPKTPKPLDVAFIPPEAVVALVIDPFQCLRAENVPALYSSDLGNMIGAPVGIDPLSVEQCIVVGGPGKKLTEYFVGAIVRFKNSVNRQEFLDALSPTWEEVTVDDRTYHRDATPEGGSCVSFGDDRTVVMADEASMKKMLAAKPDSDSPLLKRLRQSDDAAAALCVVEVVPLRGLIGTYLVFGKPPFPFDQPPLDALKDLPKYVDEIVVKYEVTPKPALRGVLQSKDEEAANKANTLITDVIEKLETIVNDFVERSSQSAQSGGGMAAGGAAIVISNLYDAVSVQMDRKQEGDQVQFKLAGKSLVSQLTFFLPPVLKEIRSGLVVAAQGQSKQKVEKIGAAVDAALAADGAYPPPAITAADGTPLLSWRVYILPFLGEKALFEQFHLDEPWNSEHNKKLISRMPKVYRTPNHRYDGKTNYLLATGVGTVFENNERVKPSSITDDKGSTILVVEVFDGKGVEWTKPEEYKFNRANPLEGLTHAIKVSFAALFADGTVREVRGEKDSKKMMALFSPRGEEDAPAEK